MSRLFELNIKLTFSARQGLTDRDIHEFLREDWEQVRESLRESIRNNGHVKGLVYGTEVETKQVNKESNTLIDIL